MLRGMTSAQLTEVIAYLDIETFPGPFTRAEAIEADNRKRSATLKDRMMRGLFGGKKDGHGSDP